MAKKTKDSVDRQASFEDVDLATLPGVTEETVQDLSENAREYFEIKDRIGDDVKRMRTLKKAIMSTIPENADKPIRYRISDVGVVECTPNEREPYEVKRAKIVSRRLKPVGG